MVEKENDSEECDISTSSAIEEDNGLEEEIDFDDKNVEELVESPKANATLTITYQSTNDYCKDWIIDLGCSNHMIGDKEKLKSTIEYKGNRMMLTVDNLRLPITHVGKAIIPPHCATIEYIFKIFIMYLE